MTKSYRPREGSKAREARLNAGLSHAKAAKAAGCSVSTVQRVEAGCAHSARLLARLARVYGVPVSLLVDDQLEGVV